MTFAFSLGTWRSQKVPVPFGKVEAWVKADDDEYIYI